MAAMTEYMTVTSDAPLARNGAIKLYGADAFLGMHKAGQLAAAT
ncbi:MAG: map, partial [Sphingomonas bacterium]|nr:map [Sphingomonas bacterium]